MIGYNATSIVLIAVIVMLVLQDVVIREMKVEIKTMHDTIVRVARGELEIQISGSEISFRKKL